MPEEVTQEASTEATTEATQATEAVATTEGAEALGDAGKKALDAMKAERATAKAEARELRQELEALKQQVAIQGKPAEEQELERVRAEARKEATAAANARVLKAEIRSLATGKLADPADALTLLDLSSFDVSESGEVDAAAISEAIAGLLEKKPYLSADKKVAFAANDTGATRKGAETSGQLTRADLQGMTQDEIAKAHREGRFKDLLSK